MSNIDIRFIEIGISLGILAIFIVLFALVRQFAGSWSNIAYVAIILSFVVAMGVAGWKLAPYLN